MKPAHSVLTHVSYLYGAQLGVDRSDHCINEIDNMWPHRAKALGWACLNYSTNDTPLKKGMGDLKRWDVRVVFVCVWVEGLYKCVRSLWSQATFSKVITWIHDPQGLQTNCIRVYTYRNVCSIEIISMESPHLLPFNKSYWPSYQWDRFMWPPRVKASGWVCHLLVSP